MVVCGVGRRGARPTRFTISAQGRRLNESLADVRCASTGTATKNSDPIRRRDYNLLSMDREKRDARRHPGRTLGQGGPVRRAWVLVGVLVRFRRVRPTVSAHLRKTRIIISS